MNRIPFIGLFALIWSMLLAGCYEWKPIELPAVVDYDSIQVMTVEADTLELYGPLLDVDTLRGFPANFPRNPDDMLAIHGNEVTEVRGFRRSPAAPYALALLFGFGAGIMVFKSIGE